MDKIFLIIISAVHLSMADVRARLDLTYLKPVDTISLAEAQLRADHISIGQSGDEIFIVSNSLVSNFFESNPTAFEQKVAQVFPNEHITIITLNNRISMYGYAVIDHGKRVRVKSGAQNIVYIDKGNELDEEANVSRETLFTEKQLDALKVTYTKAEARNIISNAAGEKVLPMLLQREFGNADEMKKKFDEIKVTEYQ